MRPPTGASTGVPAAPNTSVAGNPGSPAVWWVERKLAGSLTAREAASARVTAFVAIVLLLSTRSARAIAVPDQAPWTPDEVIRGSQPDLPAMGQQIRALRARRHQ